MNDLDVMTGAFALSGLFLREWGLDNISGRTIPY
jgi:hypothetical protein